MKGSDLTPSERREFAIHEEIITEGLVNFIEVGRSLAWVKNRRAYREDFATFEDYCRLKWGLNRSRAYRLIGSSGVVDALVRARISLDANGATVLPMNEAQTVPLQRLLDKGGKEVANCWAEALDTAPTDAKGKLVVTAKHVEATVFRWIAADEPYVEQSDPPEAEPKPEPDPIAEWNAEVEEFCRGLIHYAAENCPIGPWIDSNRATIALESVKAAAALYRLSKGRGECPACDGARCEKCRDTGFMPRRELETFA